MRFPVICVFTLAATLASCSFAQRAPQRPTSPPLRTPTRIARPTVAANPATTSSPIPAPKASAAPAKALVLAQTPMPASTDQPLILSIKIDRTEVHSGDTVSGSVTTSLNVASVEARIADFTVPVPKVGPGRFALAYTVPDIPFFLHHRYAMDIVAHSAAGKAVHREVDITVL